MENLVSSFQKYYQQALEQIVSPTFLYQVGALLIIYLVGWLASRKVRDIFPMTRDEPESGAHSVQTFVYRLGGTLFPVFTITLLKLTTVLGKQYQLDPWLLEIAMIIAVMLFLNSVISNFVVNKGIAAFLRWIGLPIVFLHLIDVLLTALDRLTRVGSRVYR